MRPTHDTGRASRSDSLSTSTVPRSLRNSSWTRRVAAGLCIKNSGRGALSGLGRVGITPPMAEGMLDPCMGPP